MYEATDQYDQGPDVELLDVRTARGVEGSVVNLVERVCERRKRRHVDVEDPLEQPADTAVAKDVLVGHKGVEGRRRNLG